MILLPHLCQAGMDIRVTCVVGVRGHSGIVVFLVGVVRGRIFLLLECDSEVEITVFLGEVQRVGAGKTRASAAYVGPWPLFMWT